MQQRLAGLMRRAGLHVPLILAHNFDAGFMLLTDLGTRAYIDALDASNGRALLREALDALIRWQLATRPDVLPHFDAAFLQREMALMPQWYLGRHLNLSLDENEREGLNTVFAQLTESALAQPRVFMHRDFMPRNLMVAQPAPGILDFQDAVSGPVTYDVASLLRDAFISWEEAFQIDLFAYYWERAKKAGLPVEGDFGEFYRQLEWMGLQRHLKILGLFARIHYRDGKPRYLADLPRFVNYTRQAAQRYRPLWPLARLMDRIAEQGGTAEYTF